MRWIRIETGSLRNHTKDPAEGSERRLKLFPDRSRLAAKEEIRERCEHILEQKMQPCYLPVFAE